MTANENPAAQSNAEAAGAERPGDELEHWLTDLRTEVAADSSEWVEEDAEPSRVGRHRAPDQ